MPVSVVCDRASTSVSVALHEKFSKSLGGATSSSGSSSGSGGFYAGRDSFHNALAASAKASTVDNVDYAEISFVKSIDQLKTKYIVLNKVASGAATLNNGKPMAAKILNGKNNNNHTMGGRSTNNGNSTSDNNGQLRSQNHGMAPPRVVLYPREKILVGWKNSMRNWQVGSGFLNIGNTCYLNSTLQALMHVPSMANWLANEFDESHLDNCPESDVGCTICSMIRTLVASQSSDSAVRPTHIFSRLKTICKQMVVGRQEDAHEFLRYLVDSMERSYLNRYRNQILDHSSKETNPLSQIFGGYLRSTVRCMDCDYVSVTFQHFQDLSLDIANVDSIEQALDQFFARENLEDMCYKCESCKRKVCASKQFSFEQAPVTLCIQLKRFNPTGVKLGKLIAQRPQLNLTKYVTQKPSHGEQLTYRLVAMITHLGQSPKCGHYTAIGLTSSGTYYEFDDSCVRPLSMNSIMNTNAYIIFYEIEKISSSFINKTKQPITGEKPAAVISTNKTNGTKCSNGHANSDSILRIIGPEMKPSVVLKDMKTMTRTVNYFTCNKNATNGNENNNNNNNSNNNYGTAKNKPLSLLNGNSNNKEQAANTAKKTVIHFKTAAAANAAVANRSNGNGNGNGNGNSGVTRKKGPVPETPLVPYAMETDDDEETTSHETTTKRQSYGGKRARSDAVTSSGDTMPKIKNFHNPFARDTDATSTNNNNNKNNNHNNNTSNGISETTGNPAINNFLQNNSQQSHRALGGLVKSWDGTVSSINGQVNNEKKEQRQREWEEDEENEMDRGRQKKVVTVKTVLNRYYNNGTPGYNPFQEQDNARRWRKPRFFTNHYNRHHYQRNKFKFQRNTNHHTYNNNLANTSTKFQRTNYTSLMSLSKAVSKTPLISSNNKNGSTTATNNNNNKSNNNKS